MMEHKVEDEINHILPRLLLVTAMKMGSLFCNPRICFVYHSSEEPGNLLQSEMCSPSCQQLQRLLCNFRLNIVTGCYAQSCFVFLDSVLLVTVPH